LFFEATTEWLIYSTQAIINLFSQYFKNEGFSPVQIGLLVTVGRVMSLIANPFWFTLKGKYGEKKIISIITLSPLFLIWGIYLLPSFKGKLTAMVLSGFFLSVILPIVEGRVISTLMRKGIEFNPSRLIGSVGFAATAFIAGLLMNIGFFFIFILLSGLLFLIFLLNRNEYGISKGAKKTHTTDAKGNWTSYFIMLISGVTALTSAIFYITFLPIYLGQKGYPISFTGFSFFIFALSEVPFLILSKKIINKIGEPILLSTGILACGLRILLSAYSANFTTFIFISLLHGWGYIVIYFSIYHFIHYHMPENNINKAQAIFWMGMTGIGYIIGSFLGGFVVESIGLLDSFFIIGIVIILIAIIVAIWSIKDRLIVLKES
jgi:PPP family 3-phenylpropionic acid transporter